MVGGRNTTPPTQRLYQRYLRYLPTLPTGVHTRVYFLSRVIRPRMAGPGRIPTSTSVSDRQEVASRVEVTAVACLLASLWHVSAAVAAVAEHSRGNVCRGQERDSVR